MTYKIKRKKLLFGIITCSIALALCVVTGNNLSLQTFNKTSGTGGGVTFTLDDSNHPTTITTKTTSFTVDYTSATTGLTHTETFKYSKGKAAVYEDGFIKLSNGAYFKKDTLSKGLEKINVVFTSSDTDAKVYVKYSYVNNEGFSSLYELTSGDDKTIYGNFFSLNISCGDNYTVDIESITFTYNCKDLETAPKFANSLESVTVGNTISPIVGRDDPEMTVTGADNNTATYDSTNKTITANSFGLALFNLTCCSQTSSTLISCKSLTPQYTDDGDKTKSEYEQNREVGKLCYHRGDNIDYSTISISDELIDITTTARTKSTGDQTAAKSFNFRLTLTSESQTERKYTITYYIYTDAAAIFYHQGLSGTTTTCTCTANTINKFTCDYSNKDSSGGYTNYLTFKAGTTGVNYKIMLTYTEAA